MDVTTRPGTRKLMAFGLMLCTLVCLIAMSACASSGRHDINYAGDAALYKNPPASAVAGDEVEVLCMMEVSDASLAFFIDDEPAKATPAKGGGYVITFTMPDHDVSVSYRIGPPTDGAGS